MNEEVRQAMQNVSDAAYQAGRFDELARAFTKLGEADKASTCLQRKVELQQIVERIIKHSIPTVVL